jgi:hypothetical protein
VDTAVSIVIQFSALGTTDFSHRLITHLNKSSCTKTDAAQNRAYGPTLSKQQLF